MAIYPLFTMLPFSVSNPSLTAIPPEDIELLYPYENGAYGHWLLGGSSSSLADGVNGRALTVGGDTPTYETGYLTVSQASGNGLASDLADDSAALVVTICAVVRRNAVSAGVWFPFGNLSTPTDGIAPYASAGGNLLITGRGLTGLNGTNTGKTWPEDVWVFMAMSIDFASGTKAVKFLRGGESVFETAPTGTYVPNTDAPFALGGKYYSTALAVDLDFAEFILFGDAKSAADLSAIYARSKIRLASRGITVV